MPQFSFGGAIPVAASTNRNFSYTAQNTYQLIDNLSWFRGRHNIKAGVDIRRLQVNNGNMPLSIRGAYSFDDRLTGLAYANFLLGWPSGATRGIARPSAYPRSTYSGFYFQDDFKLHPTVARVIEGRRQMAESKVPVEWGMAETLAYASLLSNGYDVRLSGQDSGRGTFAHRHAVLHDQDRERWDQGSYIPLQHVGKDQGDFVVIDSLLSEEAVLGFEYGFSTAEPNALVIWEAQFGDFANGAQVVMDQFISSGETKWGRVCGLVQFLPHGYEGQGPEHSSARLERYLQLCAEHNIQVCVPSTAAQIFHLLRRQMLRPFRKPLVVMTPKSLLRKKEASSPIDELANGSFQTVIPEIEPLEAKEVKRIIACCGKVYYDLIQKRNELKRSDVAVIRVEQLYPFPHKQFEAEMKRYPAAVEVVWCQEEPQNQGAWYQTAHYFRENMREDQKLFYAGRAASAAPASGYAARHTETQKALVEQAFGRYK